MKKLMIAVAMVAACAAAQAATITVKNKHDDPLLEVRARVEAAQDGELQPAARVAGASRRNLGHVPDDDRTFHAGQHPPLLPRPEGLEVRQAQRLCGPREVTCDFGAGF